MRNTIATILILLGIVIAAGAEDITLTWLGIMVQGIGGTILAGIGALLYKEDGEDDE